MPRGLVLVLAVAGLGTSGCHGVHRPAPVGDPRMPRELNKVSMPDYVLEPPDILLVELTAGTPKAPYIIRPLDSLGVRVPDPLPNAPLSGVYAVELDGTLNFGPPYGSVKVSDLTVDQAREAVKKQLSLQLKNPDVDVTLSQSRPPEQVRGPHLVRPDGSIGLGGYGAVRVVGMTLPQAKEALEAHLSAYFDRPQVSLEIGGYNSKVYYVLFDGAGAGQQLVRQPITGNETVLDAIGQVNGLPPVADTHRIWISRPSDDGCACQVLPVDWKAITECGDARTNYQMLPGDRLFVNSQKLTKLDNVLGRVLAPMERVFGFTLLGSGVVRTLQFQGGGGGGGFGGGFGGF